MIEFDDITPLDFDERIRFYESDWWLELVEPSGLNFFGFKTREGCWKTLESLKCGKPVIASYGPHKELGCNLRKGHKGECWCWHPTHGIISQTSEDLTKVEIPEDLAYFPNPRTYLGA